MRNYLFSFTGLLDDPNDISSSQLMYPVKCCTNRSNLAFVILYVQVDYVDSLYYDQYMP